MDNNWRALLVRECLDIFIGDTEIRIKDISTFDFNSFCDIHMPYLSGPEIVEISNRFGLDITYSKPQKSRWAYMYDLLNYCIENGKMQSLMKYIFDKKRFVGVLDYYESSEQINTAFAMLTDGVIERINVILAFNDNKFCKTKEGIYYISKEGNIPEIEVPKMESINHEFIQSIYQRAKRDIINNDFDSALTKARTLLEEVFCFIIEENGRIPSDKGDVGKLYNQVKELYDMHQKEDADKKINGLLSGLEKILISISSMRNLASDSHGVGSKRYNIQEHHARLYVNSSMTFAEFILSVYLNKKEE